MPIVVDRLCFDYGSRRILDEMSLDLEGGNVISILGPNGVGKTTFLKCICRLHRPNSGTVRINGRDISDLRSRELSRLVSYVPQRTGPSGMTVFDAVMIGRRPHIDWSITDYDIDLVWRILNLLDMEDFALKYLDSISGGELQKIHIARAIAQETEFMILDEPTNNLDIANQHDVLHLIRQLVRKKGMSAVMTMHDINLALAYSDRYAFIKGGRAVSYGDESIVTEELISDTYGINVRIHEIDGRKFVVPERDQPSFLDLSTETMDIF